jgi:hypothetical protein
VVVIEKNDEDVPSKNWEDSEVHTLIAICSKIEVQFLKNVKKQGKPLKYYVLKFLFCNLAF